MQKIFKLILSFLIIAPASYPAYAFEAGWTLEEILAEFDTALSTDGPIRIILARKIYDSMHDAGVSLADGNLNISIPIAANTTQLAQSPPTVDADLEVDWKALFTQFHARLSHLGYCEVLLPGHSLLAIRNEAAMLNVAIIGDRSQLSIATSANELKFGFVFQSQARWDARLGLKWGGTYPLPAPVECVKIPYPCFDGWRPDTCYKRVCSPIPLPGVELACRDWTDWVNVDAKVLFKGNIRLNLAHTFTLTNRSIGLDVLPTVSGELEDLNNDASFSLSYAGLYPDPSRPSDQNTIAIMEATKHLLLPLVLSGRGTAYIDQQYLQPTLVEKTQALRNQLANGRFTLSLPADVNGALLEKVRAVLRRQGISQAPNAFVAQHLSEIIYYLMTDNTEQLQQLFAPYAKPLAGCSAPAP